LISICLLFFKQLPDIIRMNHSLFHKFKLFPIVDYCKNNAVLNILIYKSLERFILLFLKEGVLKWDRLAEGDTFTVL
jgi:hypothetical protein